MVLFVDLNKSEFDLESCNVVQHRATSCNWFDLSRAQAAFHWSPVVLCALTIATWDEFLRVPVLGKVESRGKLEDFLHERNMIG